MSSLTCYVLYGSDVKGAVAYGGEEGSLIGRQIPKLKICISYVEAKLKELNVFVINLQYLEVFVECHECFLEFVSLIWHV